MLAKFKQELALYRALLRHPHTPRAAKGLLGAALAYRLSPLDLIPAWIPVRGPLDDLITIAALIDSARALIPRALMTQCARRRA